MMDTQKHVAAAPFNDTAPHDIILHSIDGVDFYVYKNILSLASSFFQTMFTLPQPTSPSIGGIETIPVAEDSQTLDRLLRLCYPVPDPIFNDPKDISKVLEAAMKYDMEEATVLMRAALISFVDSNPLQVYAFACSNMLEKEARAAAESWKAACPKVYSKPDHSGTFPDWSSTSAAVSYLPEMPSGAYFRLLRFVRGVDVSCFSSAQVSGFRKAAMSKINKPVPNPLNYEDADIILRSSDGIDFRVHKVIISLLSPNLLDNETTRHGDLPIFEMPEDGKTIAKLLELCYPNNNPDDVWLGSLDNCAAILTAAQKYKCSRAISVLKRHFTKETKKDPLRVYFTAIRFGWKEEAEEAARCAAGRPIEDDYVPAMESMSAAPYYRLLKYCHSHRSVVVNLSSQYRYITEDISCQENDFWNMGTPGWWHMDQNASNSPAWVVAPVVLAYNPHHHNDNEIYRWDSFSPRNYETYSTDDVRSLIRESGKLVAEIEEELSKIKLEIDCDQLPTSHTMS